MPNDFSPGLIEAPVLKLTKSNESAFLLINFGFDDYIWVFNIDGVLLLVLFVATMVVFVPFYSIWIWCLTFDSKIFRRLKDEAPSSIFITYLADLICFVFLSYSLNSFIFSTSDFILVLMDDWSWLPKLIFSVSFLILLLSSEPNLLVNTLLETKKLSWNVYFVFVTFLWSGLASKF